MSAKCIVFFLFLSYAFGASADCLSGPKVQAVIRDFEILKSSEFVNVGMCDAHSMVSTLLNGLIFLKDLGDLNNEKSVLNHNWMNASPYDFFRAHVKKIVLDDNPDCVGLSQVWPSERPMKIMHLCTRAVGYDRLVLGEALEHEAWHMEPGGHDHAICIGGENYRRPSCDETYESGGAYAVGVEFLIKISQTPRLDPALREQARTMAEKALRERFNTSPITKTVGGLYEKDHAVSVVR